MSWHQIARAALEGQSVSSNPNGVPGVGGGGSFGQVRRLDQPQPARDRWVRNHP
jgi:hypothetical protein